MTSNVDASFNRHLLVFFNDALYPIVGVVLADGHCGIFLCLLVIFVQLEQLTKALLSTIIPTDNTHHTNIT